jgi:hypothetical protein
MDHVESGRRDHAALSTKQRRVNVSFDSKDTAWYGVIPIAWSLTSKGLFSSFKIK